MQATLASVGTDDDEVPRRERSDRGPDAKVLQHLGQSEFSSELRAELVAEIESMAMFQLSDGGRIPPEVADALDRMETGSLTFAELIPVHRSLAELCPAKPRAIRALHEGRRSGGSISLLGPTPIVRRLTLTSILFAALFFGTSLSGEINLQTITMSIYELSGAPLAIKLLLITSAAGLGASFAVLFDVWDDLAANRFDPLEESANWMRIGLGVVAGLILAEIVSSERALTGDGAATADEALPLISGPLLALIGGFSATVLHMIMTSVVEAFRRAFGSPESRAPNERSYEALLGRLSAVVEQREKPPAQGALSETSGQDRVEEARPKA